MGTAADLLRPQDDATETKLIFGFDYFAAGFLKKAKLATRCEVFQPLLVWGQLPPEETYFSPRSGLDREAQNAVAFKNFHWFQQNWATHTKLFNEWPGLRAVAAQYDRVELWADPDPNAQLALLLLLDHLSCDHAVLEKARLYQSPVRLGGTAAETWAVSLPSLRPVEPAAVALASKVWRAYSALTPEGIPPLLEADLSCFPFLRAALITMLEELPAVDDGLGATQRSMLGMLTDGAETPRDILSGHDKRPPTFSYWQLGAIFDDLCRCRQPAISGLNEGPFTYELHDDRDRHRRYKESRLSLTDFGRALLDGQADFARENIIDRWWGGTALRNDALWRWDRSRRTLITGR